MGDESFYFNAWGMSTSLEAELNLPCNSKIQVETLLASACGKPLPRAVKEPFFKPI